MREPTSACECTMGRVRSTTDVDDDAAAVADWARAPAARYESGSDRRKRRAIAIVFQVDSLLVASMLMLDEGHEDEKKRPGSLLLSGMLFTLVQVLLVWAQVYTVARPD